MWTLNVQDQQSQRGEVTILDNVLRPGLGGKTTVAYSLARRGSVTILVSDMRGDIVAVLVRAVQDAGQHAASWDGRNRAGRIVAPGLYYVKVVGPGINEIRKVLVGK
jgi:flagellar hook assembly protein FlgD